MDPAMDSWHIDIIYKIILAMIWEILVTVKKFYS